MTGAIHLFLRLQSDDVRACYSFNPTEELQRLELQEDGARNLSIVGGLGKGVVAECAHSVDEVLCFVLSSVLYPYHTAAA
jgi:hypothetical protein